MKLIEPVPDRVGAPLGAAVHAPSFEPSTREDWAIRVRHLGKRYRLFRHSRDRIKQWLFGWRRCYYQDVWALRGVSLEIAKGQSVALMGANGSGKSTLLQILAGTLTPTEGTAELQGRVTALLELGSGFHPDFTGEENVRLAGSILGLSPDEMNRCLPAIAAMAELGDYLQRPLRTYSSGMIVRLAFAVAASVQPEILLVDEALAVGDLAFQQRCFERLRRLREQGTTLVLVSHDLETCKRFCDVMYVLEHGRLIQAGPAEDVADWYFAHLCSKKTMEHGRQDAAVGQGEGTFPEAAARITGVECLDEADRPTTVLRMGQRYRLRVQIRLQGACSHLVAGFYLRDRFGCEIMGSNTADASALFPSLRPGDRWWVEFAWPMRLRQGKYSVSAALAKDAQTPSYHHWIDHALMIEVVDPRAGRRVHGLVDEDVTITIRRAV